MIKKIVGLAASALFLGACGTAAVNTDHKFDDLVNETTFSNEHGYEAWTDYKEVRSQYTLGDMNDTETVDGSSVEEIDAIMDEDLERFEVDLSETDKMVFYRYPDEEGGEFSDISDFLAEIGFYFIEDNLVYSSVTPGYYNVSLEGLHEFDVLSNITAVSDILELDAPVYTVSEMKYDGELFEQAMIPMQPLADQAVMLNAFYFLTVDEEVRQYAYLPFEMAGQDFSTYGFMVFNSFFQP